MEQLMKLKLSGDIPCLSSIPLGTFHNNKYYIGDECLTHLEEINVMLKREDPNSRPLRRAIGFMDILNKDLIPILTISKDQTDIFYSTIKLLVELTTPVECLVSVNPSNRISPSQHIAIHELTQLLYGAKESFLDGKTTQVILNHLLLISQKQSLSSEDCELVNHSLLLIRNILHAPERQCQIAVGECQVSSTTSTQQQQNRILWNLYAQGLSHLLINLLGCSQATEKWSVTIVQLISLFYKDRPVETIQNMLRDDIHSSESSEDDGQSQFNQSRRSSQESISSSVFHSDSFTPPNATPKMTLSGEMHKQETGTVGQSLSSGERNNSQTDKSRHSSSEQSTSSGFHSEDSGILKCNNLALKEHDGHKKKSFKRRCRDNSQKGCSNRTFHVDIPTEHPANHVPPTDESLESGSSLLPPVLFQSSADNGIKRNIKGDTKIKEIPEKEQSRKKFTECNVEMDQRFKLFQYQPTEKDIAQLVKEFTVDFLLNGYNTLVKQLHQQLLKQGETYLLWDKSHFCWLICYFLPIAVQLETSVEHLKDVLTIDLLCYLTWEAVCQTEELEIYTFQPTVDLKPCVRRLHLSVMAIREYVQTLESYFRLASGSNRNEPGLLTGSEDLITRLSGYVPAIRDLRQLFLLQLRQFDPVVQSRRYLLDVIATNHILLLALERSTGQSSRGSFNISQHLTQFCSEIIVDRYGTALEDFKTNGPFVNDCILTILHHIAGDLGRADLLCRPVILRPFSKIWKEEFNMCDDWNDLIELTIQKSMRSFQKSVRSIKETSRSSPNEPLEIKVSASHLTDTLPLKCSDKIKIEESTETNQLSYEVPDTNIKSLLIQLKDSGFQKQLDWIQSSLLSACAVRLGIYSGQEFRHPIYTLSFQMNLSCPLVPWTEVEASALRSELFLNLLFRIGLIPPSPQAVLYPRIPREWSPDTLYSVALLFGPIDQKRIDFDLTRVKKIELDFPYLPINELGDDKFSFRYSTHSEFPFCDTCYSYNSVQMKPLSADPYQPYVKESFESRLLSEKITSPISISDLHPFDSISTSSSLQVHKCESTDGEEETEKCG